MMKIPVPKGASRRAIRHFHDEAIVYVWKLKTNESVDPLLDPIYVYIDPISDSYTVTRQMFQLIQYKSNKESDWTISILFYDSPEGRWAWDGGAVSKPSLFLVIPFMSPPPSGIVIDDCKLRIIGDRKYDLSIPVLEKEEEEETSMKEDRVKSVSVHRFWNVRRGLYIYIIDPEEVQKLQDQWGEWFYMGSCSYVMKGKEQLKGVKS